MSSSDRYLALALELLTRAAAETDPEKRAGLEALAATYRETAEQMNHAGLTVEFEVPPSQRAENN